MPPYGRCSGRALRVLVLPTGPEDGHLRPVVPPRRAGAVASRAGLVLLHRRIGIGLREAARRIPAVVVPTGIETRPVPRDFGHPQRLIDTAARTAVALLPTVLADLRRVRPDLIVHGAACPWGPVAASEPGVPAASAFTTMAFNRRVPSPSSASWELLAAAATRPRNALSHLRSRWRLSRRYDTRNPPLLDLVNAGQSLNPVFTSRAFQPGADSFDQSYRFVGPSVGARPHGPSFPAGQLRPPVLYASLGAVFDAAPQDVHHHGVPTRASGPA